MSTELQSLTKEEIKQRELSPADLWIIKVSEEVKGPYELENLKAYIQENESLFEEAMASRMEPQDWKPLFTYPQFQRRGPQVLSSDQETEGPFWVYEQGLKSGPFEKFHILKRLEMNSLIVTDKISIDDGKTWVAIYQFPDFDRRELTAQELPLAPLEQTLAQMYGKEETKEEEEVTSDLLTTSAHRGLYKNQVLQFKAENYTLPQESSSFWSNFSLPDWFMPSAIALGVMVIGGVMFALTPSETKETLSVADITEQSQPLQQKRTVSQPNPSAQLGRTNRIPASVKSSPVPRQRRSSRAERLKMRDRVPTSIETHHVERYPADADPNFGHYEEPYTNPYDNPFGEDAIIHEAPPAANLVPPRERRRPSSVSDVMGYHEDVVDEASDF